MERDEICILCGINSYCGPTSFCEASSRSPAATQIAHEIHDVAEESAIEYGYEGDCVTIGHFDVEGDYIRCGHYGEALHPTGDGVVVRRVSDEVQTAYFCTVVEFVDGRRTVRTETSNCNAHFSEGSGLNIWIHVACWAYLQEWLASPLLSRIGRTGEPLSLAGELYEVTASRHQPQEELYRWLPCIDYGGSLEAYMGTFHQRHILGPRQEVKHIVQALKSGRRGQELIPAVLKDSRFWMWTRPDIWPRPVPEHNEQAPLSISSGPVPQPRASICMLPSELFPELLQHCQPEDIFALAATCKALHAQVLDGGTLACTLRHATTNASRPLRWTLPVPSLREEWSAACEAMQTWLPADAPAPPFDEPWAAVTLPLPPLPLFDPTFPVAAFLRAYRDSDSMRARRRRWGLIKQWDALFTDYRGGGWEHDVFTPPGTTWARGEDGVLRCQCRAGGGA
ncbi:hypothetical protein PsYK624_128330 [Phanerochaete sordida]|uniref:F-box domain-containing protein n=1 Tax=Phanerochaete sordida TaxID=48140 RepID=A0A9P3GIP3_9APHY|nr:hypothetical protein PsYK624_128330 [Phanerochaete sordida]